MYWHKCCSIATESVEQRLFLTDMKTRKTLSVTTWTGINYDDKDSV